MNGHNDTPGVFGGARGVLIPTFVLVLHSLTERPDAESYNVHTSSQ